MLYYFFVYLAKPFYWMFKCPQVEGRSHMVSFDRAIYACNHLSMSDPITLALVSPRVVHFMAKQELFRSFFGRLFFKSLLAFPVNRHQADLTSVKTVSALLEKEKVVGIFPEGHRSVTEEMDELERGVAFLALRNKCPIVPIYIDPQRRKKGHVRVVVGEPISVDDVLENVERSARISVVNNRLTAAMQRLADKEPEAPPRAKFGAAVFGRE